MAKILLGNISVTALLDTGSCVSVMAESFYRENFSHINIQPVGDILHIECADGKNLPYDGYIEIEYRIDGLIGATVVPVAVGQVF